VGANGSNAVIFDEDIHITLDMASIAEEKSSVLKVSAKFL